MKTRRALVLALAALPLAALGQAQKIRRIGFLAPRSRSTAANPDVFYDTFVHAIGELGYVEGRNLVIEWRFADGKFERLPALAAELVRANVEVIMTHSTPATQALQKATTNIPIVTTGVGDPVASGFASSLARPGGNITGISNIASDMGPKQLELLKIMVPKLSAVAFLMNPGTATHSGILRSLRPAAQAVGVKVLPIEAGSLEEIQRGFATLTRGRVGAVIVAADALFLGQRRPIAELALNHRLPSMFTYREEAEAGGLISYGPDGATLYRRAAAYVDRILKGAKARELPFEQPTKFHLAISRRTAQALGIPIPREMLLRADEVIG